MSAAQTPDNVTVTVTTKGASMADIRRALPEYFTASVESAILATAAGTTGTEARKVNLARALVGAALEKLQSGNAAHALGNTTAALESLKGKAAERVNNALSHVMACPNKAMHKDPLPAYTEKAGALFSELVNFLTPEAPKPTTKTAPVNWKARAETAEQEVKTLRDEVAALLQALAAAGAPAPAVVRPLAQVTA